MAENKKSVLLYCDIIHTVKELSNAEQTHHEEKDSKEDQNFSAQLTTE